MSKSSKKRPFPNKANETAPVAGKPTSVSVSKLVSPALTAATSSANPLLKPITAEPVGTEQRFELLRFDKRAKWYIGIVAGIFVFSLLFKLHYVSLSLWNQILPDGSDLRKGLVAGTPRPIRMDDYCVAVPWMLSNANQGLPVVNETVGGNEASLLLMPNHHSIMLFRPNQWGFLFLDAERGVCWNFTLPFFLLLVSSFLFFLVVTRNKFWLSVFGSVWLTLSSGTLWWSSGSPAPAINYFSLLFVAGMCLLYSPKFSWKWVAWSLVFTWMLFCEVMVTYPSYQVPLGAGYLVLFLAFVWENRQIPSLSYKPILKIGIGLLGLALLSILAYSVYQEAKPTVDAVVNTVYPGKRDEPGGTGFIANWYVEFFSWLISDTKLPRTWLNICETSHYITFVPILLPLIAGYFWVTRQINWQILLLSLVIIAAFLWIEVGYPVWLAKATFMNMCTPRRVQLPLGILSVILTILYLSYTSQKPIRASLAMNSLLIAGVFGFMIYAAYVNVEDSDGFFKFHQLFVPILFFSVMGSSLIYSLNIPNRTLIFGIGMTLFLLRNLTIHPLSVGLSPITDHALYKAVREISSKEPKARWVSMGSQYTSYLITATGVKLLSGVKFIPNREIMKVLDPSAKRDSAYNRYAHVVYSTYINGTDSVVIQNTFEDGYTVAMDPCSPRLKKLNVNYVVFDRVPQPVEVRCMKLIQELGSIRIYQRQD